MFFASKDFATLATGEKVYAITRPHGITIWPRLIGASLVLVIPFFFLFTLMKAGWTGVFLFIALELAGAFMALRVFLLWQNKVLLVTSHRVLHIQPQGFRGRSVTEAPLASIEKIVIGKRSFWEMLWRMGALKLETLETAPEIVCYRVPRPEKLQALIEQLRQGSLDQDPVQESSEQRRRILDLLHQADTPTLFAIEALLQTRSASSTTKEG